VIHASLCAGARIPHSWPVLGSPLARGEVRSSHSEEMMNLKGFSRPVFRPQPVQRSATQVRQRRWQFLRRGVACSFEFGPERGWGTREEAGQCLA